MTHRPGRRERLQVIFAFLVVFGGMMFVVSPDRSRAQTLFRLATVLTGLTGLAGLAWLNVGGTRG